MVGAQFAMQAVYPSIVPPVETEITTTRNFCVYMYVCLLLINVLHGIYVDAHASCAWFSKDI